MAKSINLVKERYAKVDWSVGGRFAYDDYDRLTKALGYYRSDEHVRHVEVRIVIDLPG